MAHNDKVDILLLGSGGREHALLAKLAESPRAGRLYVAPGNGGMWQQAQRVDVDPACITAKTHYVRSFASGVWKGNVFGVQFHPEKSSGMGARILQNFVGIVRG